MPVSSPNREGCGRQSDARADLQRTVASSETWIGYANSLRIVEGWNLKQAALREIESGTKGPAVERFCGFVAVAKYAD
jgi:hypothetical protein